MLSQSIVTKRAMAIPPAEASIQRTRPYQHSAGVVAKSRTEQFLGTDGRAEKGRIGAAAMRPMLEVAGTGSFSIFDRIHIRQLGTGQKTSD